MPLKYILNCIGTSTCAGVITTKQQVPVLPQDKGRLYIGFSGSVVPGSVLHGRWLNHTAIKAMHCSFRGSGSVFYGRLKVFSKLEVAVTRGWATSWNVTLGVNFTIDG